MIFDTLQSHLGAFFEEMGLTVYNHNYYFVCLSRYKVKQHQIKKTRRVSLPTRNIHFLPVNNINQPDGSYLKLQYR